MAVKLQDPQFEGQTKGKLGTISMRSTVEKVTNQKLAEWLEEHPAEGKRSWPKRRKRHGRASRPARRATRRVASPRSKALACPAS